MTGTDKNTLPFLMASLKEVQDTVRAYDTKAQIVGVGYIVVTTQPGPSSGWPLMAAWIAWNAERPWRRPVLRVERTPA